MKLKQQIKKAINDFKSVNLFETGINLFQILGYNTQRQSKVDNRTFEGFYNDFIDGNDNIPDVEKFKDKALTSDWQSIEMLFQLTESEMNSQGTLFSAGKVDNTIIEAYLFFAIELKEIAYSRTKLSDITRYINRVFPMPVMVLFKYGEYLTLSVIKRRLHKRDENRDVLKKVTLIKDIKIEDPHRAHIEILFDLSLEKLRKKYAVTNFVELHNVWQKTLDSSELNKKFYKKLANWYYWAVQNVEFPADAEKNAEIRNASSVIRLLTRLIFVWFIKEKDLVTGELFDKSKLDELLNYKDKNESSFYKAVLQNLFFATLSTEKKDRKFRDKRIFQGKNKDYKNQHVYRYEPLVKNVSKWKKLFENIPFLNGGLFECLDNKEKKIRIDGFSDRDDNVLKVPDFLFFSEKREIDLNKIFGTKNKKYKVKGLIHLLNRYKFTIAENTPIEEEIALDPELLGKVFENLLASYNPETKTTARKQTGSFYTPREIVDYMVDESLKASLSNLVSKKIANATEDDIKTGLDILFAYTEKEHAFNDLEVSKVIETVSEIKILDPACGSGAFPMGILHKLVFILNKLDKHNEIWKELQKQRALKETETAYNLGNKDDRHQRLTEIEKAFNFNTSDYGRKLFLIENSIYGVDIQPIAVQIAKLRFFISLIVDQDVDKTKENLGILPLPNLETKFVAANTLIGVDKPDQGNFADLKTKDLENELLIIRHKHFNAKTQKTKKQCREKDKRIRYKIARVLKKSGWPSDTAEMLAAWDPYDQNQFAGFFDMEWMFGIKDGFDIVIGNPPYFSLNTINKEFVVSLANRYKSIHTGYNDIVYYFIYIGIELLNPNGFCIFITSNYYLGNNYAKKLREYLKKHVIKIINFKDRQVFSEASIHTCITCSSKKLVIEKILFFESTDNLQIDSSKIETSLQAFEINRNELKHDWIIADKNKLTLINKLNDGCYKLGDISIIEKGPTSGKNEVFTVSYRFAKVNLFEKEILKKNIKNGDISRYSIQDRGNYLIYTDKNTIIEDYPNIYSYLSTHKPVLSSRNEVKKGLYPWYRLERPRKKYIFDASEKIVVPYRSETNKFAYDNQQYFNDGGDIRAIVLTEKSLDIKFILALLNSKVLDWLYGFIGKPKGKSREYFNKPMSIIPIKTADYNEQKSLISLVDNILNTKQSNPSADTTALEAEIDGRVAHLYNLTEEEYSLILKETNCSDPFRVAALNVYRDIAREK